MDDKKLNLPTIIGAKKGLANRKAAGKKIASFDLARKTAASKVINKQDESVQAEVAAKSRGLDLMLVGDLTGSMSAYYTLLKAKFTQICQDLFQLIRNLRIGIIFYLDHGSGDPYVTTICQPTVNVDVLLDFICRTPTGNGGDADEAVEDALNDLAANIQWKESNNRSVVLFGDARPHMSNHCPSEYDYERITEKLYDDGSVRSTVINSVFCGAGMRQNMQDVFPVDVGDFDERRGDLPDAEFFSWIANVTGGMALSVENVDDLIDIIVTAAAKDAGKLDDLAAEVKASLPLLNLIDIARKAAERKQIANKKRLLLTDK